MDKSHYLRCRYGPGMFSSERTVAFDVNKEDIWIWASKEDVVPDNPDFEKGNGRLSVYLFEKGQEYSLIGVNDDGEHKRFVVPSGELSPIELIVEA